MIFEKCVAEDIPFVSPGADFANRLLNGDPSKGDQGLLVRTTKDQDTSYYTEASLLELFRKYNVAIEPPLPPFRYLLASHLHASMRAGGAVYDDWTFESFTIMIGTSSRSIHPWKGFNPMELASSATMSIQEMEHPLIVLPFWGMSESLLDIRVDGECLVANDPKTCGGCKVKPEHYGELVSRWTENVTSFKLYATYNAVCYYDSLQDAMVASNSMWATRERWYIDPNPMGYNVYTEHESSVKYP